MEGGSLGLFQILCFHCPGGAEEDDDELVRVVYPQAKIWNGHLLHWYEAAVLTTAYCYWTVRILELPSFRFCVTPGILSGDNNKILKKNMGNWRTRWKQGPWKWGGCWAAMLGS